MNLRSGRKGPHHSPIFTYFALYRSFCALWLIHLLSEAYMIECNVDLLILNLLCNVSPCQIETGEADKRYSAAVCKTNEPYPLPRPVFCP
jgi:hypothetical protein